jgi:hypothetical protein
MAHAAQGGDSHTRYHLIEGSRRDRIEDRAVANKLWSDLITAQKRGIVLSGSVQLALLAATLVDIYRRSKEEIRGNKLLWTFASFVNFVGPISYFFFGCRR